MVSFVKSIFNSKKNFVQANTIDELDEILHQQAIDMMKNGHAPDKESLVNIKISPELHKMGLENIHEILMMKAIERALNDPSIKEMIKEQLDKKDDFDHDKSFEENILPILKGGREVTYH